LDLLPFILLGAALLLAALQLRSLWGARRLRGRAVADAGHGRQVFYFHSPHCGPCRALTPMVQRLAAEYPQLRAVDATADPELARRFGIMGTPTFVATDDGLIGEVVVGGMTEARLKTWLGTQS
jgi:thioredoxin 1